MLMTPAKYNIKKTPLETNKRAKRTTYGVRMQVAKCTKYRHRAQGVHDAHTQQSRAPKTYNLCRLQ